MTRWALVGSRLYLLAVYVFILGPMLFVVYSSLNNSTSFPSAFEGFTTRWFTAILGHREFIESAWTSAIVATLSAVGSTATAFLAAYSMMRGRKGESAILGTLLATPILVPQIVLSLGILQLAALFDIGNTLTGLIAVHTVHGLPFALRLCISGFARFDFALEEAAFSLGAGPVRTWWNVTLPLLRPSLIAGFTFCFILSFVNLPISLFLTDAHTNTLPVVMYAYIESRIDPMLAAVSALLVLFALISTLLLEYGLRVRIVE